MPLPESAHHLHAYAIAHRHEACAIDLNRHLFPIVLDAGVALGTASWGCECDAHAQADDAGDALHDETGPRIGIFGCEIEGIHERAGGGADREAAPHPAELVPRGRPENARADRACEADVEADEAAERDAVVRLAPVAVRRAAAEEGANDGSPEDAGGPHHVGFRIRLEQVVRADA